MKCLILGVATIGTLASGCTGPCSRIDVSQGLLFSIDNGPAPANYELQFEHAHGLLTVNYGVMADGTVQCVEDCEARDGVFHVAPEPWTADSFTPDLVSLALTGAEHLHNLPHDLHLTVLRDGVAVHDQVYTPSYKVDEAWGEGCGEAVFANIDVMLAP